MAVADIATLVATPPAVVRPVGTTRWAAVTVRPGDTLWDLAIAHRTTVGALVARNHLPHGGSRIHPGQRLLVPVAAQAAPAAGATRSPARTAAGRTPARTPARTSSPARLHVVAPGETLSDVALRYRVPLRALLSANRLPDPDLVRVGQRLRVPAGAAPRHTTQRPQAVGLAPPAGTTVSPERRRAVEASRAKLARAAVPTRSQTAALIRAAAQRHGVDPRLALAVGWLESGWNQRAVSYTDAVGVMQLMPASSEWASALAGRHLDRYDARDNVTGGVVVLRALLATAKDREEAVAGYYQGLASVRARGTYADTDRYVRLVLALRERM